MYKPLDRDYPITQRFGANPKDYGGYGLAGHNGLDYGTPVGTPVYAADEGEAFEAQEDSTGYGRHLKIQHSHGYTTYAHLSARYVADGEHVQACQVIGLTGGDLSDPYKGNSSGPHLHFGYRPADTNEANGYSGYVDPTPYLMDWTAAAEDLPPAKFSGTVTAEWGLCVRPAPGDKSREAGAALPFGTHVEFIGKQDGWYQIRSAVPQWVSGDFIVIDSGEVAQEGTGAPAGTEGPLTLEALAARVDLLEKTVKEQGKTLEALDRLI